MNEVRQLSRITFGTYLRVVPGLASRFRKQVPATYWTAGDDAADVRCVCGTTTHCQYALPTPCSCDRWFLYDGVGVRVARA